MSGLERPLNWKDVDTTHCPVAACADVLQDRWAILILRDLLAGLSKYGELQRHTGASTAILAKRLRSFVGAGIVKEQPYMIAGQRAQKQYILTPRGMSLAVVIGAMAQAGLEEFSSTEEPIARFVDRSTSQQVRVGLVREDGQAVDLPDVKVEMDDSVHSPNFRAPSSRQLKR